MINFNQLVEKELLVIEATTSSPSGGGTTINVPPANAAQPSTPTPTQPAANAQTQPTTSGNAKNTTNSRGLSDEDKNATLYEFLGKICELPDKELKVVSDDKDIVLSTDDDNDSTPSAINNSSKIDSKTEFLNMMDIGKRLVSSAGTLNVKKEVLDRYRNYYPVLDICWYLWTKIFQSQYPIEYKVPGKNIYKLDSRYILKEDIKKGTPYMSTQLPLQVLLKSFDDSGELNSMLCKLKAKGYNGFKTYTKRDFKCPKLSLGVSNIAIIAYHNDTIESAILKITKLREGRIKSFISTLEIQNIIYYPIEYITGRKKVSQSLASGLLPCMDSIAEWYVDHLLPPEKDDGKEPIIGLRSATNTEDQNGYINFLKGQNPEFKTVKDCKTRAVPVYDALNKYATLIRQKEGDFTSKYAAAGKALGNIFHQ